MKSLELINSIFLPAILLNLIYSTLCQSECNSLDCYVNLGPQPSRKYSYQLCQARGYEPVRIRNQETADLIAQKYANFWLNIEAYDPGYYSYVNGSGYQSFAGETPPPSQKQCAYINSKHISFTGVNPNLEYCYKHKRALCAKRNCNQDCLFLLQEEQSWFDSRKECFSKSADLAVVVLPEGLPSFQGTVWMGLRHEIWHYADTNKETDFTNWADNKPEDVEKKCVVAGEDGTWFDVLCEDATNPYDVLCYNQDGAPSSNSKIVAAVAGVVASAVVLFVAIGVLVYCLCKRKTPNKRWDCSCACLPIACCVKKSTNQNESSTDPEKSTKSEKKNKRRSVRDFLNKGVANVRHSLFGHNNRVGAETENHHHHHHNSDSYDEVNYDGTRQQHGFDTRFSGQYDNAPPKPTRHAPAPPVKKKSKPLPPVPRKTKMMEMNEKLLRPFSGLKQNFKKRFSRSDFTQDSNNRTGPQSYENSEPQFLDGRQVIPIGEASLRKSNSNQHVHKTPGGANKKLPPPPRRTAPELQDVVRKHLPPVPPPKPSAR